MLVQRQGAAFERVEVGRFARAFMAAAADLAKRGPGAAHPVGGAVLMEILAVMIDVERGFAASRVRGGRGVEIVELDIVRIGFRVGLCRSFGGLRWLIRRGAFEQRVLLDLLGDEAFDLEIAEREQADRLLQLRRHHQRLGLSEFEAGPERHGQILSRHPRESGGPATPSASVSNKAGFPLSRE